MTVSLADAVTGTVVEVLVATPEHPFFTVSGMVTIEGQTEVQKVAYSTQTRRLPPPNICRI
ncbi:MAG: hypothetical protein OHK0029_22240 [Armatimonadaceae bacterium]